MPKFINGIFFGVTIGFFMSTFLSSFFHNHNNHMIVSVGRQIVHSNFNKSLDICDYGLRGPRILCGVFTHYKNLKTKALGVNDTWGNLNILVLSIALTININKI